MLIMSVCPFMLMSWSNSPTARVVMGFSDMQHSDRLGTEKEVELVITSGFSENS